MVCHNCHCERCAVPEGAEIIALRTSECCFIFRDGQDVVKVYRDRVRPKDIEKRAAIAAAHPDLFVPFVYDAATHRSRQAFVAGEQASPPQIRAAHEELHRRGEWRVGDLNSPGNTLVDAVGRVRIVDFLAVHDALAMRMRKRRE